MKRALSMLVALTLCVSACNKKEEQPEEKPKAAAKKTEKPKAKKEPKKKGAKLAALSPDEPKVEFGDIPTAAELEEEAAKKISPENLESELDRLEAEIVGLED